MEQAKQPECSAFCPAAGGTCAPTLRWFKTLPRLRFLSAVLDVNSLLLQLKISSKKQLSDTFVPNYFSLNVVSALFIF